ncbi:MAG: peptide ABC transporter substrate-binding protein [Lysobacterales bacterium]
MRKPALWRALLAAALWLAGGAMAAPRTLERGNGPEPDSLDPQRAQGLSAQQVLRDLFEGLMRDDAEGHLVPGAAESYTVSADGLRYRFTLREQARYADGSALMAEDFVYSLGRALDPATAAPYAAMLLPIRGAGARLQGRADAALGVQAVDARTLEIELTAPRSDFLRRLAMPVAMPVQRRAIEQYGSAYTRAGRLYGNGAYRLADWTPQAQLTLERNPHYRNAAAVPIERVRYHVTDDASQEQKRFEAGELHLTETLVPGQLERLRERFGTQVVIAPAYANFYLGLNTRRAPLDQPALREALSLAIDRDILVRYITGNGERAAYELIPPLDDRVGARIAWASWPPERRHARARALLREAGIDASTLSLELRYNTSLVNRRLALAVASMWQQVLGIEVRLRNEEWKVFVQNRRAGLITQVFRGGWFADYAEPLNFLEPFSSGHALNATGYADAGFDALLAQAARGEDAATALQKAEQRLLDQHVLIPLYHYSSKHLVSPALCGYRPHPLDHHPSEFLWFCDQKAAP